LKVRKRTAKKPLAKKRSAETLSAPASLRSGESNDAGGVGGRRCARRGTSGATDPGKALRAASFFGMTESHALIQSGGGFADGFVASHVSQSRADMGHPAGAVR
jgi:hypothetical protein